jgi:hypothetical protein
MFQRICLCVLCSLFHDVEDQCVLRHLDYQVLSVVSVGAVVSMKFYSPY